MRLTEGRNFFAVALLGMVVGFGGCQFFTKADPAPKAKVAAAISVPVATPKLKEISFRAMDRRTVVLMYHDVIAERKRSSNWFDCSVVEFEAQMKWIQDNGITPISITDLYSHLTSGTSIPEKAIVLTFDDNYQGFYDHALPILEKYQYPSVMFVHTGYVGDTKGAHPKMTWETLRELVKNPLITIGAHTVTHPAEMGKLSEARQNKELSDSKKALEEQLKTKMDFMAYPFGQSSKRTWELAEKAGFLMSFSIDNGMAQESPSIMNVSRYIHTRLEKAFEDQSKAVSGSTAGIYHGELYKSPVQYELTEIGGVKIHLVKGGDPRSLNSSTRTGVLDFVKRASAAAGINGTYFAMASLKGTSNMMVGPFKSYDIPMVLPDKDGTRLAKIVNRPLVMWDEKSLAILPFVPGVMNSDDAIRTFMPNVTDAFLGCVWLVRGGAPRTAADMAVYASKDFNDVRKRAAFGIMYDGKIVLAATKSVCSSEKFSEVLAAAGVSEAVLLDSGFSTSLIFDNEIKAFGHATPTTPSRPVPHAIVLLGELAPEISVESSLVEPGIPPIGR